MTYQVGNDTPVWLKPRRTVYFVFSDPRTVDIVKTANGRRRFFRSYEAAEKLANKLNKASQS